MFDDDFCKKFKLQNDVNENDDILTYTHTHKHTRTHTHTHEGNLWPALVSRFVVSLIILHLTLIGVLILKSSHWQWILLIPLPLLSFSVLEYWTNVFRRPAEYLPISLCSSQHSVSLPGLEQRRSQVEYE